MFKVQNKQTTNFYKNHCWLKNYTNLLGYILEKRSIVTKGIDDLWTTYLIDMKKYSEENLLNVTDMFFKFAWALPIKKKENVTVLKAFEKVIKSAKSQNHKSPNLLHTDKGLEFENKHLKTFE